MTDPHAVLNGTPNPPESQSQLIASLAIISTLAVIGVGLIIAGVISGDWTIVSALLGTVVGILGTALNAPSGISKVISAAKQPSPQQIPKEGT